MLDSFSAFLSEVSSKKQKRHCLLVEPHYHSTYPPLGLLKISQYLKMHGWTTELVKPPMLATKHPDIIFVTSLFTYEWETVKETVEFYRAWYPKIPIILGGIYQKFSKKTPSSLR